MGETLTERGGRRKKKIRLVGHARVEAVYERPCSTTFTEGDATENVSCHLLTDTWWIVVEIKNEAVFQF